MQGASSDVFIREAMRLMHERGYRLGNLDATIIAEVSTETNAARLFTVAPVERRAGYIGYMRDTGVHPHASNWQALAIPQSNKDGVRVAQRPKLSPVKEAIRDNLCSMLSAHPSVINIKAKTHEKVDSLGENRSIACHTVVLLIRDEQ